jgi:hypothetical protein
VTTACLILAAAPAGARDAAKPPVRSARYEDLVSLFADWRSFQKPKVVDGVPDYTPAAMAAQKRELASYQRRLASIDPSGWPIAQQADWHVVRAEMNGLDFDHRVLQPWATTRLLRHGLLGGERPARAGGAVRPGRGRALDVHVPAHPGERREGRRRIRPIPKLLAQAKTNLVGKGKDLWTFGAKSVRQQSAELEQLAKQVSGVAGDLPADVARAKEATDAFAAWLDSQAASKTEPSGVGVENYNWYLKNVQLVPYTWQDEVTIMERELGAIARAPRDGRATQREAAGYGTRRERGRVRPALRQRRRRVHGLPQGPRHPRGEGLDGSGAARRVGTYSAGPREFFGEVDYRDPELMRTHGYHWFDKGRMVHEPHASPIRRGALLYNIFNTRTEGHATGWEELMVQAGMFDARPRTRELLYILLAERAARALGDLRMTSNEFTLEQASAFASAHTPRGWLSLDGNLVRGSSTSICSSRATGRATSSERSRSRSCWRSASSSSARSSR